MELIGEVPLKVSLPNCLFKIKVNGPSFILNVLLFQSCIKQHWCVKRNVNSFIDFLCVCSSSIKMYILEKEKNPIFDVPYYRKQKIDKKHSVRNCIALKYKIKLAKLISIQKKNSSVFLVIPSQILFKSKFKKIKIFIV